MLYSSHKYVFWSSKKRPQISDLAGVKLYRWAFFLNYFLDEDFQTSKFVFFMKHWTLSVSYSYEEI